MKPSVAALNRNESRGLLYRCSSVVFQRCFLAGFLPRLFSCVLSLLLCLLSFSAIAVQRVSITVFRDSRTNDILWGGDGNAAWDTLQLERRGIWLYSYVLSTSGLLYGLDIDIADNDTLQNVYDRLATNPIPDFKYVDWGGDWSGNITPYYKTGHVFFDSEGNPTGVVVNNSGDMSTVSVQPSGEGYISAPVVDPVTGATGTFQVRRGDSPSGWVADFVPNWDGGKENTSSPTTSTGSFNPSQNNVGGSTGSSSGGNNSPSSGAFNYPSVSTFSDSSGNSVVNIPSQTVVLPSGSTFEVKDYSSILSSMAGVLQSHATANHDDLSTLNSNLQKLLEVENEGDLNVSPPDDREFSVDFTESDEALSEVSRWGFDFGLGSNPIGDAFTALLGNPPNNFGSVDEVWDIEIPIMSDGTRGGLSVRSTFRLSSWFPRAFRSLILFCATIAFSIASMHSISNAFS